MRTPKILLIYSCGDCCDLHYVDEDITVCGHTGEQVDKYWRKDSELGFPDNCPLENGVNPNSREGLKNEAKEWINEIEKDSDLFFANQTINIKKYQNEREKKLTSLLKEVYDWTRYKNTKWAKRVKKVLELE